MKKNLENLMNKCLVIRMKKRLGKTQIKGNKHPKMHVQLFLKFCLIVRALFIDFTSQTLHIY
jgi:hypothetical protein